jgi:hypothetical protein
LWFGTEGSKSDVIFDLFETHEKKEKARERFSETHGNETALLQYSKACHKKIEIEELNL